MIIGFSLRGHLGNPHATILNSVYWKENGPFELSPERGRYSLLYSLVKDKSFHFSEDIGKFASPDVVVANGKFASMFAPLVSFITIPGYMLGRVFGAAQIGTYATIGLFAIINMVLVQRIALKIGAGRSAAWLGGLSFLFATPAYSYGVNLYQHHLSTFLILLALDLLISMKHWWQLSLIFLMCAFAIPLDYPNLFFLFPIGLAAISKILKFKWLLTMFSMIFPILFFGWFNFQSYGNPFQLSGTLPSANSKIQIENTTSVTDLESNSFITRDEPAKKKNAIGFFKTRSMLNGFYVQFISPDRGMIVYTPLMALGFLGMVMAYRKRIKYTSLFIAIIGANILLYSMWGDPWGGWAFGTRYLIPSYALLSILIAVLLTYWRKKIWFILLFGVLFIYSVGVNTLGAITSSANPPQVEVLALEALSGIPQKYTYQRNWDNLMSGTLKSFVYQTYLRPLISPVLFYGILTGSIALGGIYLLTLVKKEATS
jgi:hypothetical protein